MIGLEGGAQAAKNIEALYETFIGCDCTMVEVCGTLRRGGQFRWQTG